MVDIDLVFQRTGISAPGRDIGHAIDRPTALYECVLITSWPSNKSMACVGMM